MPGQNPQTDRETCYFCADRHTELLEVHHIVPRRHGGTDTPENLVDVCPTCHRKLENLYDERFYTALGMSNTDDTVEFIAETLAYELLSLRDDILTRLTQVAEWTDETWVEEGGIKSDLSKNASKLREDYTEYDYEHVAAAIFDDMLPDEKELKVVEQ